MHRILVALVILVAAATLSLGQAKSKPSSSDQIRKAIEAANQRFVKALSDGEAATIADLYSVDARVLPPNSPMVQGSQKIREFWQTVINMGAKLSLSTSTVAIHGDIAHEVGTYEMVLPGNARDSGKYVVIWKRRKGVWKLALDIWNSDMPTSGQSRVTGQIAETERTRPVTSTAFVY